MIIHNRKSIDKYIQDVSTMEVKDKDDNNLEYTKTIYYLSNSVRVGIDTLISLYNGSKTALGVYITILYKLNNNTNVVKITRSELKAFLELSDASISKSIKELTDKELIEEVEKDTYCIPLKKVYKGNLNKMLSLYEKDYAEIDKTNKELKKEEQQRNSIDILNLKRKSKLNKNNASKSSK